MPVVHVYMWSGVSKETKAKIVKGAPALYNSYSPPSLLILAPCLSSHRK